MRLLLKFLAILLLVLPVCFAALVLADVLAPKNGVAEAIDKFKPKNAHGDAKLAVEKAIKKTGLFGGEGVPIGYSPKGRALHYPGFGHLLTVAAARTGKGATLLVNALLSWRQSCIVIDPKCENALITSRFRKRLGKVHILNPFRMFPAELGSMQARFNPMDSISAASPSFHADCDKLAASVIWEEGRENSYFVSGGRVLCSGVASALIRHGDPAKRNLVEVARVISSGPGLFTFCRNAMQSKDPFIIQKLQRFALPPGDEPSREMNDVIATAITQLAFLSNEAIAESLSGSDFRFADLKKRTCTVFICLPLSKLDICDKYFRLILETALSDLLNEGTRI